MGYVAEVHATDITFFVALSFNFTIGVVQL